MAGSGLPAEEGGVEGARRARVAAVEAEGAVLAETLAAKEVKVAAKREREALARAEAELAEAGAGAGSGPEGPDAPGDAAAVAPEDRRDWAGLPEVLLEKVAGKLIAQSELAWAAQLKKQGEVEHRIQWNLAQRKREGNCLFVFARVCRRWRKAQRKVGGPLRTRVPSDVLLPGRVALVKWALAEGCPREASKYYNMAMEAASHGHLELVRWLCGEGGFAMDEGVMRHAARSGNLELVQRLRGEGYPWDWETCAMAVEYEHVKVLRWLRENGCPWMPLTREEAHVDLGYTDHFGNLVDVNGRPFTTL